MEGTANNIVCKISGASNLKLENFAADNTDTKSTGSSKSIINHSSKLDVNLRWASDLSYYDNPVMGDTKISGGFLHYSESIDSKIMVLFLTFNRT